MHVQHLVIDEVLPPRLDALLRRQFGIQTAGISPPAVSFKTVSPAMTQQLIFVYMVYLDFIQAITVNDLYHMASFERK